VHVKPKLLACLGWLLLAATALAEETAPATNFTAAEQAYAAGRYAEAAARLEALLAARPDCGRCAHLLGKSYGRQAELASWFDAVKLARQACTNLERAVTLLPEDRDALEDLLLYYREAPAFLGGGDDKARSIETRLATLPPTPSQ
jgi:tetratricopeptide (TPR) repeat protein